MSVVDNYLKDMATPQRKMLEHIRVLAKKTVPDAVEVISYGIPALKYNGKYLFGYAGFKDHMSLFPGAAAIAECCDDLNDYKLSKGTVQFTLERPIPDRLVKKLILVRLQAIETK